MEVPWFMTAEPPPNYVAGLGRGVQGFTTRSDIGPARSVVEMPVMPAVLGKRPREGEEDGNEEDPREANGNNLEDETLFASVAYDHDDDDADRIYGLIDDRMDSRRKERREMHQREELEKFRLLRPKIQHTFADLKADLKNVTADEWLNIPEIGDKRPSWKDKKQETFTPMPDTMIEKARQSQQYASSLEVGGLRTPAGMATPMADLTEMGTARKQMLSSQLQHKADSVKGQTNINPKGYLTDMNSRMRTPGEADINDIRTARTLLASGTRADPSNGATWIAAARVEEHAGKLSQARKLMMKACENAPKREDVWLETARLHPAEQAKTVLSRAVKDRKSTRLNSSHRNTSRMPSSA